MTYDLFYEVLQITEHEARLTARFRTLADAQRYVRTHESNGPWDIVTPDGRRLSTRSNPVNAVQSRAARRAALLADTLPAVKRADKGAA